ncbi:hypothetical protein DL766_008036 [Monosporascus sp. MC13-8B]|uniref:Nucleotide-diphospho-sugar transferase domain-containing protein n=1 Tax=Monosporascus cannonballus TaxID=155416 RepID=A0ABY0GVQ6_9PEZI|nr:hypothetical protein DL762_008603 [Monosporascus cannonballus]RYO88096.1 hypothetical protein DL763_006119 [Monosporascus cannonballus]RYP21022.1 hypothetical protein DL766_008036 [Monosporascus sp. MC13-8B]
MAMRGNSNRLAAIASAIFITLILFYTTEPRRRSFSCKTFESCLAGRPHSYQHALPVEPTIYENEQALRDGTRYFTREINRPDPEILILVLNKDEESWSRDFRSTDRSIYDFLDLLISTNLDLMTVSLSLMTSSSDEYLEIKKATATLPFARTNIYYQPDHGPSFPYEQRHDPAVQRQRRAAIAALRNYLMLRSLRNEEHIVWIDADVVEFSEGIIQTMIAHSDRRDDVGMITATCHQNEMENYDKNAWAVDRNVSAIMGAVEQGDHAKAVQTLTDTRYFTDVLNNGTSDNELLPLDSVGGTILYIRAGLIRQGVTFPTFNVVGTTWSQDGWIGVETEGICYVASSLKGGGCFLLGGRHHIRHADLG